MRLTIVTVAVLSMLLTSCSVFQKKVDLDMQPFSDNTTVLFQEAAKVDRPFQFKSLSIYKDIEKYSELKQKADPIIDGLHGITYYSNQLVAISNSKLSEKGKNKQLTIYVEEVLERIEHRERMDSIGLNRAQIDSVLIEIRRSESFREGVEAADPVVKSIVLTMYERLEELEYLMEEVVTSFEDRIYKDHELAIQNYLAFKELQNTTQYQLTQVYYAQSGRENSLSIILEEDKALSSILSMETSNSQRDFENAEQFLLQRLKNVDTMIRQLEDDKVEFMDMKQEISSWHLQADEKIRITRNSLMVWSQAHKNLGQGIVTPALIGIDTVFDLLGSAVKTAF